MACSYYGVPQQDQMLMYRIPRDHPLIPSGCDAVVSESKELLSNPSRHDDRKVVEFKVVKDKITKSFTLRRSNSLDNISEKFKVGLAEHVGCKINVLIEHPQTKQDVPAKFELRGYRIHNEISVAPHELSEYFSLEQLKNHASVTGVQLPEDLLSRINKYKKLRQELAENLLVSQKSRMSLWLEEHLCEKYPAVDATTQEKPRAAGSEEQEGISNTILSKGESDESLSDWEYL